MRSSLSHDWACFDIVFPGLGGADRRAVIAIRVR